MNFARAVIAVRESGQFTVCNCLPGRLKAFSHGPDKIKRARMEGESPKSASTPTGAVFLSYASQDADAARRICEALRAVGIEVWFDQSELRGGDVWDQKINDQIHRCRLFVPVISAHTESRDEGYFRREWSIAVDRMRDMAEQKTFLVPVVIDATIEQSAAVPDRFKRVHWSRLGAGEVTPAFIDRIAALLDAPAAGVTADRAIGAMTEVAQPLKRVVRPVGAVLGFVVLAIAVGGVWFAWRHFQITVPPVPSSPVEKSIAVLPFVDLSEKGDQEYLANGMAEEVLDQLTKIPGIRVISRTSSFQFRGGHSDVHAISRELGAAYVVTGSVRRSGDHLRVAAQLLRAHDGARLWSDIYDTKIDDSLAVQTQIAGSLARALQVTVGADELSPRARPKSAEAYDYYLRGLHAEGRFDLRGFEAAIADFRHALELDPSYVPAAEALARALKDEADFGLVPPQAGWEQARNAAEAALRLNGNSAVAHAVLSRVHAEFEWDWVAAKRESDTAMALAPQDADVLSSSAVVQLARGQWEDAARLYDAAVTVDPLNADVLLERGWVYLRLGRLADAESTTRRALEISPTYSLAHHDLGIVLLSQGRIQEALAEMQREAHTAGRLSGLAIVLHALHRSRDGDAALEQLETEYADSMALKVADVYAFRGQTEEAFSWLDRAYAQRDFDLYWIKADPLLKPLGAEPRYKAFLRKMNLPE